MFNRFSFFFQQHSLRLEGFTTKEVQRSQSFFVLAGSTKPKSSFRGNWYHENYLTVNFQVKEFLLQAPSVLAYKGRGLVPFSFFTCSA